MSAELLGTASLQFGGQDATQGVTQQMMQLGASIEQIMLLIAQQAAQASGLRERLDGERGRQLFDRRADESERLAWQAQRDGVIAAMEKDLAEVTERLTQLAGQLRQAQDELARLQAEELPAAALADLVARFAKAEEERRRLDDELAHQRQELVRLLDERGDSEGDGFNKRVPRRALAAVSSPRTHLGEGVPEGEAEAQAAGARAAAEASQGRAQQMSGIVSLIGDMVKSQGGKAARTASLKTAPINAMTATLQSRWSALVTQMSGDGFMDVNQLIQWVMREAYVNNTDDLKHYAYKVKFFTDLKRRIREELHRARVFQSQHQDFKDPKKLDSTFTGLDFSMQPALGEDGSLLPQEPVVGDRITTGDGLDEYIKHLDNQLNTVGDDAQLAQIDLQNITQRQQQALQTLSTLSKVLHETSMAIIRKIGA